MSATDDFQQFIDQVKEAMRQFITGNPAPLKALYSHADDVTVFGGFGAYVFYYPLMCISSSAEVTGNILYLI